MRDTLVSCLGSGLKALGQFVWGQVYGAFLAAVSLRYALNLLRGKAEPIQGVFDVLPLLSPSSWRVQHHAKVVAFGVTSEVLIAGRV